MYGSSGVKCKIKVIELKDDYRLQITGGKVKGTLKPESLKKCIQACCSGELLFKGTCPG